MPQGFLYECDNPKCKHAAKIDEADDLPYGWWQIFAHRIGPGPNVNVVVHHLRCSRPALERALEDERRKELEQWS